jgi:hemerythrin-like domain-containing protein
MLIIRDYAGFEISGEEAKMVEIIDILQQEHRNLEKLLQVMEQELEIFDRGERPDYETLGAVIDFFKNYPDSCHHPKEDIIYEKFKAANSKRAASIADLQLSIGKVQGD